MSPTWFGVGAILMWSVTALLLAIATDIPPLQLSAMSWFIGFLSLGTFYVAKGENLVPHFKRPLKDYAFVGGGVCGYTVLLYLAYAQAPAFEANALNYLWPILLTGSARPVLAACRAVIFWRWGPRLSGRSIPASPRVKVTRRPSWCRCFWFQPSYAFRDICCLKKR